MLRISSALRRTGIFTAYLVKGAAHKATNVASLKVVQRGKVLAHNYNALPRSEVDRLRIEAEQLVIRPRGKQRRPTKHTPLPVSMLSDYQKFVRRWFPKIRGPAVSRMKTISAKWRSREV
jgi:hypothetical protein